MTKERARQIAEATDDATVRLYSGRGMFGRQTHAVQAHRSDLSASLDDMDLEIGDFRAAQMGLDIVIF